MDGSSVMDERRRFIVRLKESLLSYLANSSYLAIVRADN